MFRNASPTTPRSGKRRAGAATAFLCLAAYFLALGHLLVVRHTTCLAHDELVHASGSVVARTAIEVARTTVDAPESDNDDHEQDHCLVAGLTRQKNGGAASPGGVSTLTAPAAEAPHPPCGAVTAPALPILAVAPKSSPPIAGV